MTFYHKLMFLMFSGFVFVSLNYLLGLFILGKNYPSRFVENGGNLTLEVARGVFCFFVFIGHSVLAYNMFINYGDFWPPIDDFRTLNYLAAVGIDGFFVITGYLFAGQLEKGISAKSLLTKRFFRLAPPFLFVTIAVVLLRYFSGYPQNSSEGFYVWILPQFAYKLPEDYVVYGHYWSLRNEWLFYLFTAAALFLSKALRFPILFLLVLISSIFDSTFSMILVGLIIYLVSKAKFTIFFKIDSLFYIITILIIIILYLWFAPFQYFPNIVRYALRLGVTFLIGLLIAVVKFDRYFFTKILKFYSYSGAPAYSLYLSHGFALYFILIYIQKTGPLISEFNLFIIPFIVVPFWVLFSWAVFFFSERPYHIKKLKN